MARGSRCAATALLALVVVSAAVSPAAASRALLATDVAAGAQEITRENADMVDIICGFPDGVSARTIEQTMMTNLTNGIFKGQLAQDYSTYRWAEPHLDDMEWLCNMMREFNNEREVAHDSGKVRVASDTVNNIPACSTCGHSLSLILIKQQFLKKLPPP